MFNAICRANWQKYCNIFGYELIVITQALDKTHRAQQRSAAWQKLLILSQEWSPKYTRIVWVDADVIINNKRASDICKSVPLSKVGAVEAYSIPSRELHDIALKRLYQYWKENDVPYLDNSSPSEYYTNRGIPGGDLDHVVQTGVFVSSPKYHRELFEYIYHSHEDTHGAEWNYEMPAMSYELLRANVVHWLSPRYNFCVTPLLAAFYPETQQKTTTAFNNITMAKKFMEHVLYKKQTSQVSLDLRRALRNIYDLSIFLHFAGCTELMDKQIFSVDEEVK